MDDVLNDLGPMPSAESPDDCAFWTAALINPVPALGVAREVRAAMLEAEDGIERAQLVRSALVDSIEMLKKKPPGPFEVEPPPVRSQ